MSKYNGTTIYVAAILRMPPAGESTLPVAWLHHAYISREEAEEFAENYNRIRASRAVYDCKVYKVKLYCSKNISTRLESLSKKKLIPKCKWEKNPERHKVIIDFDAKVAEFTEGRHFNSFLLVGPREDDSKDVAALKMLGMIAHV